MDRDDYIEQWIEHFVLLNKRKPNRQEKMCFKVGFNAGEHSSNNDADAHEGGKDA